MVIPRSRSALSLSSTHAYLNDDCSETGAQISRPTPQTQTLDPGADFKPKARASEMLARLCARPCINDCTQERCPKSSTLDLSLANVLLTRAHALS